MSPRPCTIPRCPNAAAPGEALCRVHGRGNRHARGYNAAWLKIRAAVLRDEPYCRVCWAEGRGRVEATDVDHEIPLAEGGTNARGNLRPLCHECHSRHTAITRSGFTRRAP